VRTPLLPLFTVLVLGACASVAPPTMVPSPTAPTATSIPTSGATASLPFIAGQVPLPAGRYLVGNMLPARVSVAVPDGFVAFQNWAVLKAGEDPNRTGIGFYRVHEVYRDPCHWNDSAPTSIGPTVDDLVAAMASFGERRPKAPVDVSVGRYPGVMVEWSVPDDADFSSCDGGEYRSWTKSDWSETDFGIRFHQASGQVDRNYIVDVDGVRLVIDAYYLAGTSAADIAELEQIVESIQIQTP
jgi:hypothetical protein